jgi:hypothetical protein
MTNRDFNNARNFNYNQYRGYMNYLTNNGYYNNTPYMGYNANQNAVPNTANTVNDINNANNAAANVNNLPGYQTGYQSNMNVNNTGMNTSPYPYTGINTNPYTGMNTSPYAGYNTNLNNGTIGSAVYQGVLR